MSEVDCFPSHLGTNCIPHHVTQESNCKQYLVFILFLSNGDGKCSHVVTERKNKQTYKLRCLRPGRCWWCTLIRLIPFSASSQNRGYWVHVNASYEGRSHSACKMWVYEWKKKTRVLKIPPWHLTCFLCGLNNENGRKKERLRFEVSFRLKFLICGGIHLVDFFSITSKSQVALTPLRLV